MFLKILKIFLILILLFFIIIALFLFDYRYTHDKDVKDIKQCEQFIKTSAGDRGKNGCYEKAYELLTPKLLTYKVKYKGNDVNFKIFPPSYIVPYEIVKDTDVMIGYGVGEDMDAEEMYSSLFNKNSYGFDCGVNYVPKNSLSHFERSCIVTDKFLLNDKKGHDRYHQVSSGNIHSFKQKINELNLHDKKLFVKADIGESIWSALPDILDESQNIDAITVVFLMPRLAAVLKTLNLLDMMNNDFILVARTEHADRRSDTKTFYSKYIKEPVGDVIVLTFVNKKIVDKKYLPWNQTGFVAYKTQHKSYSGTHNEFKPTTISKIVVLNQKIENLKMRLKNRV